MLSLKKIVDLNKILVGTKFMVRKNVVSSENFVSEKISEKNFGSEKFSLETNLPSKNFFGPPMCPN